MGSVGGIEMNKQKDFTDTINSLILLAKRQGVSTKRYIGQMAHVR